MSAAIETQALGKRYGDVIAVDHLSLRVEEGEIYAFLGLNGAGKTTTIRMLLGMIRPTSGSATVLGTPVRMGSCKPWDRVGYLVEVPHAYPELTVFENLEAARRMHPGTPQSAVTQVIERLGLETYAHRRAGTLSQGNAQRLGLAKALLHAPQLLVLDEPANGLDPAGIVEIRELLSGMARENGVTVFMSSHILAEVARLAQRIGIIHNGKLIQEISVGELERNRRRRLVLRARAPEAAAEVLETAGRRPERLADRSIALSEAAALDCPEEVASLLVQAGVPPMEMFFDEEDLEQYFLRLVGMDGERK